MRGQLLKGLNWRIFVASLLLLAAVSMPLWKYTINSSSVVLTLDSKALTSVQVFCDAGYGFSENNSVTVPVTEVADRIAPITLPLDTSCTQLRLDLNGPIKEFRILGASIRESTGAVVDILSDFWISQYTNDVAHAVESSNTYIVTGVDPWIVASGDYATITSPQNHIFLALCLLLLTAFILHILIQQIVWLSSGIELHAGIIIVVLIGLLLRVSYWNVTPLPSTENSLNAYWPDEAQYFGAAKLILDNGFFSYLASVDSLTVAPGNPIYVAAGYSLFHSINAVRFLGILLSIGTIYFAYEIGRSLFSERVALASAFICSINLHLITYSATILTEPPFIFLFVGFVLFFVKALTDTRHSMLHATIASIMLAGACLTRSILMLLPLVLITLLALFVWRSGPTYTQRTIRSGAKVMIVSLFIPVILITGVSLKNYLYFGRFGVSTGSGAALWLGSRQDTDGDEPLYRGRKYDTLSVTKGLSHLSIEGDAKLLALAKRNILKDPVSYLWISLKKPERLLIGNNLAWFFPKSNIVDWYIWQRSSAFVLWRLFYTSFSIVMATFVAIFSVFGAIYYRRSVVVVLPLIVPVVYVLGMSMPFLAIQRYGAPIIPLTTLLAIASIHSQRMIQLMLGIALVAVLALPIFLGV